MRLSSWTSPRRDRREQIRKKCLFACFALMRNIEIWSEMKMEQSKNKPKKKQKTAIIFASKRNEAKQKRKTSIIFASKWTEAKRKWKTALIFASKQNGSEIFSLRCEKNVFSLVFASKSKRKWNEAKTKRKRSETKNFWKRNKGKKYPLLILLWSESKNSKRKEAIKKIFAWTCETDLVLLRFALKRKIFFAKPAHPTWDWPSHICLTLHFTTGIHRILIPPPPTFKPSPSPLTSGVLSFLSFIIYYILLSNTSVHLYINKHCLQ